MKNSNLQSKIRKKKKRRFSIFVSFINFFTDSIKAIYIYGAEAAALWQ